MWGWVTAFGIFWLGLCWIAVENVRSRGRSQGGYRGGALPPGFDPKRDAPAASSGIQPPGEPGVRSLRHR